MILASRRSASWRLNDDPRCPGRTFLHVRCCSDGACGGSCHLRRHGSPPKCRSGGRRAALGPIANGRDRVQDTDEALGTIRRLVPQTLHGTLDLRPGDLAGRRLLLRSRRRLRGGGVGRHTQGVADSHDGAPEGDELAGENPADLARVHAADARDVGLRRCLSYTCHTKVH